MLFSLKQKVLSDRTTPLSKVQNVGLNNRPDLSVKTSLHMDGTSDFHNNEPNTQFTKPSTLLLESGVTSLLLFMESRKDFKMS